MKTETLHFVIEGEWFTWFLRHLWVEGNHAKALKTWEAAFPTRTSKKWINGLFIDIVSGKKKFVGDNTFEVADDNMKFWNSDNSSDEGNTAFPLIDSWEDVMLLKKVRLYIHELDLRSFRLNRRHSSERGDDENMSSRNWDDAILENRIENRIREKVNELYTDIRNVCYKLEKNIKFDLLPEKLAPLQEAPRPRYKTMGNEIEKNWHTRFDERYKYRDVVGSLLNPIKEYFDKKYGGNIFTFTESELDNICEIPDETAPYNWGLIERAEDSVTSTSDTKLRNCIGPGILDVDSFIKSQIEDSHRDTIAPEDVSKTKWNSGYIDRDGMFYGCSDIGHRVFAEKLCDQLDIDFDDDAQIQLDELGWVKVSMNRFTWLDSKSVTDPQKQTIFDYMNAKGLERSYFGSIWNKLRTFGEAFGEDGNEK